MTNRSLQRIILREALQVLRASSVHLGAQLRTAFVLSAVLEENGVSEEAQELRRDTMNQLKSIVSKGTENAQIDEAFFDQFVLFCHR
jgi:hypothetical protein